MIDCERDGLVVFNPANGETPEMVAERIELRNEPVLTTVAGKRSAAEVKLWSFKVAYQHNVVISIDGHGSRFIVAGPAEAAGPERRDRRAGRLDRHR